jgi:hypothetical protein
MSKPRILLAGAALFVTLICWSLSSPINSHQDEKFHLASIWCADGFDENCEYVGLSESAVETVLLKVNLCTPANTEETYNKRLLVARAEGKCKLEFVTNQSIEDMSVNPNFFHETDARIAAWIQPGHTSSIYYKVLNFFDIDNKEQSVIRFRGVNSLIFVLLLIAFLIVSEQRIRSSALLGLFFTMIPHGLFLISGVTTSSWAYTGCSLSWAFLYVLLNQRLRFNWKTGLATLGWIVSSGLVVFSRYDAIIYLAFTNLAVLVLKIHIGSRRPKIYLSFLFVGCSSLAFLAWMKIPKIQNLAQAPVGQSNNPIDLLIVFGNAVKLSIATPIRILGLQSPGWGPVQLSHVVFWTNLIFWSVIVFVSIRKFEKTQTIFFSILLGFLFGVYILQCYVRRDWTTPFYLIRTSWRYDSFWPRYFIPYFPFLFGMLVIHSRNFLKVYSTDKFKIALFTVLGFTQSITLYDIGGAFRQNPSWYWQNFPIEIDVVFLAGVFSFIFFLYFVMFSSSSSKIVVDD